MYKYKYIKNSYNLETLKNIKRNPFLIDKEIKGNLLWIDIKQSKTNCTTDVHNSKFRK